ncbi:galactose-specific lectin nattectin-like [Antennarius striatus]|uniref:galactose-specific lectin nattectin-like n=1 Tax=Antennarius striatus TaxID=241820 RepID=UPI0035AE323A
MASSFYFLVLICLTSGLWMEANAWKCHRKNEGCCPCQPGWVFSGKRCFMFIFEKKTWAEAELACIGFGGNLAAIWDEEEYRFVRSLVEKSTGANTTTWVGGHDAPQEGIWHWSSGIKFNFTLWGPTEPNNRNGKEHCMEINLRGRDHVNDQDCHDKRSFVCAARDTW